MRRAIVHIGMPRTGTTTLQRILYDHRSALEGQGVLYPDLTPASAAEAHLSHQHLGEALDGRRPTGERDELLGGLKTKLQTTTADIVLLSYESLALAPRRLAIARRLGDLFAGCGFEMEVLVTVKPQSDYINSMYTWRTQFLKEGRPFGRYLTAALSSPRLRYDELLRPWRDVAGRIMAVPVRDPVCEAPLISRVLEGIGLVGRVGGMFEEGDLALVENRSPGPFAVEASRRLAGARGAPSRDVTRLIERLDREAGGDSVPFQGVDAAQRARVGQVFSTRNERFAAMVWGRSWATCVAEDWARPVNELANRPIAAIDEARICKMMATACEFYNLSAAGWTARNFHRLVTAAFSNA